MRLQYIPPSGLGPCNRLALSEATSHCSGAGAAGVLHILLADDQPAAVEPVAADFDGTQRLGRRLLRECELRLPCTRCRHKTANPRGSVAGRLYGKKGHVRLAGAGLSHVQVLVVLDNYISRGTDVFLTCKQPDYLASVNQARRWHML